MVKLGPVGKEQSAQPPGLAVLGVPGPDVPCSRAACVLAPSPGGRGPGEHVAQVQVHTNLGHRPLTAEFSRCCFLFCSKCYTPPLVLYSHLNHPGLMTPVAAGVSPLDACPPGPYQGWGNCEILHLRWRHSLAFTTSCQRREQPVREFELRCGVHPGPSAPVW